MRKLLLVIALIGIVLATAGQLRRIITVKPAEVKSETVVAEEEVAPEIESEYESDTVYACQTVKVHGWFQPNQILSKEDASHRALSVRFTRRNKAGKWTRFEAVDGYGNPASGALTPYIMKSNELQSDTILRGNWADRINSAVSYEIIPDPTGEVAVQERAYDKDGNIVYIFSRTPAGRDSLGRRQFICSYKDNMGLPAEMRLDNTDLYTYGTLILLTEDEQGRDCRLEYIDGAGKSKPNSDGVAAECIEYNSDHKETKRYSVDANGNNVRDNWTNCGILVGYDKNGDAEFSMYVDENMRPMAMESERSGDNTGVIKILYAWDKYHRIDSTRFVDADNRPYPSKYGVYSIKYTYDLHGNETSRTFRDVKGRLVNSQDGYALQLIDFDSVGRLTCGRWFDKDGRPLVSDFYLAGLYKAYKPDGNLKYEKRVMYSSPADSNYYMESYGKDVDVVRYWDGSWRIDSLDSKGRMILRDFKEADGSPSPDLAYVRNVMTFDDLGGSRLHYTDIYYGYNGQPVWVQNYASKESLVDSVSHTIKIFCDGAGVSGQNRYEMEYTDSTLNVLKTQYRLNSHGKRIFGSERGVRYYAADAHCDLTGNLATFVGRDEFGEPAYIFTRGNNYEGIYYYRKLNSKGYTSDFDENDLIPFRSKMDEVIKLMSVEIINGDSVVNGLRDNDLILLYGCYSAPIDSAVNRRDFALDWSIASVVEASVPTRVIVFRVDPVTKEYGLVEIKDLKGTPSEIGFRTNIRYLTERQADRIREAVQASPLLPDGLPLCDFSGPFPVNMMYPDYLFDDELTIPYFQHTSDPLVLLGEACIPQNSSWTIDRTDDLNRSLNAVDAGRTDTASVNPVKRAYFTTDGRTLRTADYRTSHFGYSGPYDNYRRVNRDIYERLTGALPKAKEAIAEYMPCTKLPKVKQLYGYWTIVPDESDPWHMTGSMYLDKSGKIIGALTAQSVKQYDDAKVLYRLDRDLNGRWVMSSDSISLLQGAGIVDAECIDIYDATFTNIDEAKEVQNNSIRRSECRRYDKIPHPYLFLQDALIINDMRGDTLVVRSHTDVPLKFVKTKLPADLDMKTALATIDAAPGSSLNERPDSLDMKSVTQSMWRNERSADGVQFTTNLYLADDSTMSAYVVFGSADGTAPSGNKGTVYLEVFGSGRWSDDSPGKISVEIDTTSVTVECSVRFRDRTVSNLASAESDWRKSMIDSFKGNEMDLFEMLGISGVHSIELTPDSALVLDDVAYRIIPQRLPAVIGRVEIPTGYLARRGYSGQFVILEWCDWNCTMTLDEFEIEFNRQKDNPKHLVLISLDTSGGRDEFGNIIEIDTPSEPLGFRIFDSTINQNYHYRTVIVPYTMWKNVR